jgi:hypothetical protein
VFAAPHFVDDGIGIGGPGEGLGVLIGLGEVAVDGGLEIDDALRSSQAPTLVVHQFENCEPRRTLNAFGVARADVLRIGAAGDCVAARLRSPGGNACGGATLCPRALAHERIASLNSFAYPYVSSSYISGDISVPAAADEQPRPAPLSQDDKVILAKSIAKQCVRCWTCGSFC